jgi:hypothetical protein
MREKNKNNGLGFGTVLFLIFLTLKLTNYITWSWWWVTSPIWIPVAFVMVMAGIITISYYNQIKD